MKNKFLNPVQEIFLEFNDEDLFSILTMRQFYHN